MGKEEVEEEEEEELKSWKDCSHWLSLYHFASIAILMSTGKLWMYHHLHHHDL
jgi:hypothetical protein